VHYRYGHLLRQLHCCADQAMTNALASMDLTAAQGHIMAFLAHSTRDLCPKDIEEAFKLSHPTVSGLLTRLEKKGFLSFYPDETDRRVKRIRLLPKGQELHDTMHKIILDTETRLVQGFTEEEKEQFYGFLCRSIGNMGVSPCKGKEKEETKK